MTDKNNTLILSSADDLFQQAVQQLPKKEFDLMVPLLNEAVQINPNHYRAWVLLAYSLRMAGRLRLSMTTYRHALQLLPDNPDALYGIGHCYKDMGQFDKAISCFEKTLKILPDATECMYHMTLIQDYPLTAPLVKELHRLHGTLDGNDPARIMACFALATVYESHKEYRRAFDYYEEGNRLQFAKLDYNEASHFANFDATRHFYNALLFAQRSKVGSADETPIFILGMPRSGSTLVEQILASHRAVYGVGEVDLMPRMAVNVLPKLTGAPYPLAINNLPPEAFLQLAEHFVQQLRSYCPDNKPRIVAKTLNNFYYIGLIHLLFPRATIIHCVRDPVDTCWSMYRHHFAGNHPYCYDQTTLGRYYVHYEQLMQHWHHVLPGVIHDVRYEQLVTQPEPTIRALIEHCRLPWDKNCLSFYRTQRPVNTASQRQVRRPIYTTSLKSWEHVGDQLAPLRAALQG